jgi:8-oxo-dGTP pyrophosphatase MutT (NUDIX family)
VRNQPVRPVDSAGLLLIREATGGPEVLLGRRRRTARAFPGEYVFPGGVVEPADACASGFPEPVPIPAGGLDRSTRTRLHVFARTALRECYEETGLLLETGGPAGGRSESPRGAPVWQAYADAGAVPAFANLLLVARAITPVAYPMRFHSRFFMAVLGAAALRPVDHATPLAGDGELEDLGWVPVAETGRLPVAAANALVLHEALARLDDFKRRGGPWPAVAAPAPCFTWRGPDERFYRTIGPTRRDA